MAGPGATSPSKHRRPSAAMLPPRCMGLPSPFQQALHASLPSRVSRRSAVKQLAISVHHTDELPTEQAATLAISSPPHMATAKAFSSRAGPGKEKDRTSTRAPSRIPVARARLHAESKQTMACRDEALSTHWSESDLAEWANHTAAVLRVDLEDINCVQAARDAITHMRSGEDSSALNDFLCALCATATQRGVPPHQLWSALDALER